MKSVSRLLLVLFVLTLLGAAMMHVFASRDEGEGQSLAHMLLLEMHRGEALDYRASEMSQLLEVKKTVVGNLVSERLTLREAAAQFRQADQQIENNRTGLIAPYQTPDSEEGLYKQVIAWTKTHLSDDPEQSEEVIPRLEREMVEELCDVGSTE